MKYLTIFFFFFLLTNTGLSQSIEMQVISSTGTNTGQLDWTMGEVAIAGSNSLTQGFHQGKLIITAIEDIIKDIEIIAYPNPTMEGVTIKTDDISSIDIRLFDLQGKQLSTKSIKHFPYYMDLALYDPGIYFIQLYDKEQILKTFKIEKIK